VDLKRDHHWDSDNAVCGRLGRQPEACVLDDSRKEGARRVRRSESHIALSRGPDRRIRSSPPPPGASPHAFDTKMSSRRPYTLRCAQAIGTDLYK
jgi:hypothetical protein